MIFDKTHYSNQRKACNFIKQIFIVPSRTREQESLPADQKSLVIMYIFTGQMATAVLDMYEESNIEVKCMSANMTHILQPLDLTENWYAKRFTRGKFSNCYSSQIFKQLDDGRLLHDIDVPLKLSLLKPIHAEWML